jgi:hypothetical protein
LASISGPEHYRSIKEMMFDLVVIVTLTGLRVSAETILNSSTSPRSNLLVESPAHRAQLFGALHRATERAQETARRRPRRCRTFHPRPIAPEAVPALSEAPSAFGNAIALVAAVGLAGVAAFFGRRPKS